MHSTTVPCPNLGCATISPLLNTSEEAAAFFFVDGDNSSDHVRSPYNLSGENPRRFCKKTGAWIFAGSFGSVMIIRERMIL